MTESSEGQKFYRVKSAIVQIRRMNAEELAGVPHSVVRSQKSVDAIDAGYLYYSNRVPLWAHDTQIEHNLKNNLIQEVTREEYERCAAPGTPSEYIPTAADHARLQEDISLQFANR